MLRIGIAGDKPKTLQQIADVYALSKECIRQIEKEAIKRLADKHKHRRVKDNLEAEIGIYPMNHWLKNNK